jgi:hypothetical protein
MRSATTRGQADHLPILGTYRELPDLHRLPVLPTDCHARSSCRRTRNDHRQAIHLLMRYAKAPPPSKPPKLVEQADELAALIGSSS